MALAELSGLIGRKFPLVSCYCELCLMLFIDLSFSENISFLQKRKPCSPGCYKERCSVVHTHNYCHRKCWFSSHRAYFGIMLSSYALYWAEYTPFLLQQVQEAFSTGWAWVCTFNPGVIRRELNLPESHETRVWAWELTAMRKVQREALQCNLWCKSPFPEPRLMQRQPVFEQASAHLQLSPIFFF